MIEVSVTCALLALSLVEGLLGYGTNEKDSTEF